MFGEFEDFGGTFAKTDVVGVFIDLTNNRNIEVTFTKNGEKLEGADLSIPKSSLGKEKKLTLTF